MNQQHAALVAENETLRRILAAMVRQLALWPGEKNPEFFPCMKEARAALTLANKED